MYFDTVGSWTEVKLSIIREYSQAYTQILRNQQHIKHFAYVDGFAGGGHHVSKATGAVIDGSPAIALTCGFNHCHFVDLDGKRTEQLQELSEGRSDVSIYNGDCSEVLLHEVFPHCRYEDYRRALCLLDPYNLNPRWDVVETAGRMRSIELFINFMIMDANMNVLLKGGPGAASDQQVARMTAFWGDESWKHAAYKVEKGLFGDITTKAVNTAVAAAYRKRLQDVAGFKYVPLPLAMKHRKGPVIYYLFFASQNRTGDKIARSIFEKYRARGSSCG